MNLQAECIDAYYRQLKLDGLAERFEAIAGKAAEQDWSFQEFLVQALAHERDARQVRSWHAGQNNDRDGRLAHSPRTSA